MEITKLLIVEEGSVDLDELNKSIKENQLGIMVIVYRPGTSPPHLIDIKKGNIHDNPELLEKIE